MPVVTPTFASSSSSIHLAALVSQVPESSRLGAAFLLLGASILSWERGVFLGARESATVASASPGPPDEERHRRTCIVCLWCEKRCTIGPRRSGRPGSSASLRLPRPLILVPSLPPRCCFVAASAPAHCPCASSGGTSTKRPQSEPKSRPLNSKSRKAAVPAVKVSSEGAFTPLLLILVLPARPLEAFVRDSGLDSSSSSGTEGNSHCPARSPEGGRRTMRKRCRGARSDRQAWPAVKVDFTSRPWPESSALNSFKWAC
mmetsp:Transcript_52787/g.120305  ORF Transcript_52787/g.120305 Transcript_52787/m.120305 type:complete len:259 (+) Transcript_52787:78-854(+)